MFFLLQCGRFEEVPEGHLLQPQCATPGEHGGLCAGPAARQFQPYVLQQHLSIYSGSYFNCSSYFLPPANATAEHVLSSQTHWTKNSDRVSTEA